MRSKNRGLFDKMKKKKEKTDAAQSSKNRFVGFVLMSNTNRNLRRGYCMLDSKRIKEIMYALGADLCGIASIDRLDNAPKGYHPLDVLPTCKSVISFGCRFPVGTLNCKSNIPYTRVRNSITHKMDAIALDFCIEMEKNQIVCVPIPTKPMG